MTMEKESILDVLAKRPIIGDGSNLITLEKRGYALAGECTPTALIDYPDAVRNLHREFLHAGADVLQSNTFNTSKKNETFKINGKDYTSDDLNDAACQIVSEVASTKPGTFISGSISPSSIFTDGDDAAKQVLRDQVKIFESRKVDFLLAEWFNNIEELVMAIEIMKETQLPVACTMRIGPTGDYYNVTPGECAVRMTKAGADIIGLNCSYDPDTSVKTLKMMKAALDEAGLSPFLMIQPAGFHCPEVETCKLGFLDLPEFPLCGESRILTRYDCRKYARAAYEAGARYIGGCCGFEPHHIREIAAELAEERGCMMPGQRYYSNFGEKLKFSVFENIRKRVGREYWENVKPGSGRPFCPSLSIPDYSNIKESAPKDLIPDNGK